MDSVLSPLTEQDQPVWNEIVAGTHSHCQKMESMPKTPVCKHPVSPRLPYSTSFLTMYSFGFLSLV